MTRSGPPVRRRPDGPPKRTAGGEGGSSGSNRTTGSSRSNRTAGADRSNRTAGADRFAARAALRRREHRKKIMIAVGVLAACLAALWVLLASPWLRVADVRVDGARNPGEAVEIARTTDIRVDEPLLKVDVSDATRRVVDMGTFATVDVRREWPSAVVVAVSPRMPVITVRDPEGVLKVVDGEAVAYAAVRTPPTGVPVVSVTSLDDQESIRAAVAVSASLPAGQRAKVEDLRIGPGLTASFRLEDVQVIWGGPEQPAVKAAVVQALIGRAGVRSINVSAPGSPVTS